jgi:hypothetical protein
MIRQYLLNNNEKRYSVVLQTKKTEPAVGLRFGHPTKIQQQTTNQAPPSIPDCTISVKKNVTIKVIYDNTS